jgi:hypothetical protein
MGYGVQHPLKGIEVVLMNRFASPFGSSQRRARSGLSLFTPNKYRYYENIWSER